jgi:hypothetical protein
MLWQGTMSPLRPCLEVVGRRSVDADTKGRQLVMTDRSTTRRPWWPWRAQAWLVWLVAATAVAVAYPPTSDIVPFDAAYLALGGAAVIATFVGIRRHRPTPSTAWWVLACGLTLTVLGDGAYMTVAELTGDEPAFPGLPDALYLPGAALLVAGGLLLAWQRHRATTTRSLIDAALVAVSAALLLWLAVGTRTVRAPEASLAVVGVGLAYPLMDAALVGVLAALVLGGQRTSVAVRLLIAAFGVQLVTDTIYLTETAAGSYVGGGALDTGWLLTYSLIAAAALHPTMAAGGRPQPSRSTEFSALQLIALTLPIVLAGASLVAVAHTSARTDPQRFLLDVSVLVPGGVVLAVLLLWRATNVSNELARTAQERDSGLLRELVVADVAWRLARADALEDVVEALTHAGDLLPGGVEDPGDHPEEVAGRERASNQARQRDESPRSLSGDRPQQGVLEPGGRRLFHAFRNEPPAHRTGAWRAPPHDFGPGAGSRIRV